MINNIERRKPSSIIYNNKLLDRLLEPFGVNVAAEKNFGMETDESFIPRWQFAVEGTTDVTGVGKSLNAQTGTAVATSSATAVGTHL